MRVLDTETTARRLFVSREKSLPNDSRDRICETDAMRI